MRVLLLACLCLSLGLAPASAQPTATASTAPGPSTRIALVTGSTDGLGRELARRLAGEGAHVIVHGRNTVRGKALVDEITAGGKGSARFYQADFASLAEVRRFTSADEGAAAVMHVIGTDAPSGSYFVGQTVAAPHAQATDPDARRQLREVSRRLSGVP